MRSVGIVCGYDLNDGLRDYVESVAPLIERENLDFVILSGGRTSPQSHHSEAWVMAAHLRESLPTRELVLEEHAMTTLENLIFARGLAEHHAGVVARFVVFCDRLHRRKVAALPKLILDARAVVDRVDHDGTHRGRRSSRSACRSFRRRRTAAYRRSKFSPCRMRAQESARM